MSPTAVLDESAPARADSKSIETFADLLERLGHVPPERILLHPPPGTATLADVERLVDGESKRLVELVDGVLVEKAMGAEESRLGLLLGSYLNIYVTQRGLGVLLGSDGTVRLAVGNVRMVDVAYFSNARWRNREPGAAIPSISPNLAVEVLSRSNSPGEMVRKRQDYFESGVQMVWEVHPIERTVTVYRKVEPLEAVLTENDVLTGYDVIPGFSLPLAMLFKQVDSAPDA